MTKIILASKSPRRRELLDQIKVEYNVLASDIDETMDCTESPEAYVVRMALEKAQKISSLSKASDELVLAADTIVIINNEVLCKPVDLADAQQMLRKLSGNIHQVLTAVCVIGDNIYSSVSKSQVRFKVLTDEEINDYCNTGEPMDKAGAYGIQGVAGQFIENLNGSYSGVMGLPLCETKKLLIQAGYKN